jgi:hypothetical protein
MGLVLTLSTVAATVGDQDDCDSGADAGNMPDRAMRLGGAGLCLGRLELDTELPLVWTGDVADWYTFPVEHGQALHVGLADLSEGQGVSLCIEPPESTWSSCVWTCCDPATREMTAWEGGLWLVGAQAAYPLQEYRLNIALDPVCAPPRAWETTEGFLWPDEAALAPIDAGGRIDTEDVVPLPTTSVGWCNVATLAWDAAASDVEMHFEGFDALATTDVECWATGALSAPGRNEVGCFVPEGADKARIRIDTGEPAGYTFAYGHH